jgi:hypothetical protein
MAILLMPRGLVRQAEEERMKAIVACATLVLVLVPGVLAGERALQASDPRVPALQARLNALQAKVTTLQKTTAALQKTTAALQKATATLQKSAAALQEDTAGLQTSLGSVQTNITTLTDAQNTLGATTICGLAVTTDLVHVTWRVIDQITTALGAGPVFGQQTPLDDKGACAALGVGRTPAAASAARLDPRAIVSAVLRIVDWRR